MSDYEFKDPIEFTIRLEKEHVNEIMETYHREIELFLEDTLGQWFEYVEVL